MVRCSHIRKQGKRWQEFLLVYSKRATNEVSRQFYAVTDRNKFNVLLGVFKSSGQIVLDRVSHFFYKRDAILKNYLFSPPRILINGSIIE